MNTNIINRSFIPGLIINVTDKCNFKCQYCPPYGENLGKGNIKYDETAAVSLIDLAKKYGVQQVRFTGGEPFYEPERLKKFLCVCGDSFRRLVVNTNASLLHKHFEWLINHCNQIVLKISLDTLDKTNFKNITQCDFYQTVHENLITAISMGFDIELNTVLYNQTFDEIKMLIDFVISNKINLKFLTTSSYYGYVDSSKVTINMNQLIDNLSQRCDHISKKRLVGERGAPMLVYQLESSTITLFDSRIHNCLTPQKCYFSKCEKDCNQYPCDYGAFSICLSTDGLLSICRGRKDWGFMVFSKTPTQIEETFLNCLKQFKDCFEINVNTL